MRNYSQEDSIFKFYINLIKDIPPLTREEEIKLIPKAQKGNRKARNRLINSLLKYVIKRAKAYRCRNLTFMDIIAEGNLGLLDAVRCYNFNKGVRFITYATFWIRQSIIRAIATKERLVRTPVYLTELVQRYRRLIIDYPDITDSKLAKKLGISQYQLDRVRLGLSAIYSLNTPRLSISGEEEGEEGDIFVDEQAVDSRKLLQEKIDAYILLDILPPRERIIIEYRFGFRNHTILTLQKVANIFNGVTREWIRQIEARALKRMRRFYERDLRR